jgi:RNA polymerase sigma-70 factor, ECF subfamily
MIVLHYFSGLTYEEMAIVFEVTPQAIHGRMQRARRKLACVLDTSTKSTGAES